jgi:MinD-like ATPase involved in chromosome partitioning or flagellar assembly
MGITTEDVETILGRSPDVFVPSDRDIAKSMTDGVPIVLSADRSEAAQAFRVLAERYAVGVPVPPQNGTGDNSNHEPERPRGRVRKLVRRQ